jgi:FMN reductase
MPASRITVVIGNPSEVSRTKVLALALADAVTQALPAQGAAARPDITVLELHRLAPQLLASGATPDATAQAALRAITGADLLIAATPVYKGAYTGLFKHLFDLVDPNGLVDTPVLLAANGGSDRHALVVDHQLRPLFAFFRALTVPSAVYAAEADFDGYTLRSAALQARIAEAAGQAARLVAARAGAALRAAA